MRNCGNCFWSFSPADEEALREEYHGEDYDLDDNNPKAGDCCLGVDHNNKYYCSSHSYSEFCEDCEEYESLGISEYISIDLYNAIKASWSDKTRAFDVDEVTALRYPSIYQDDITALFIYDLFGGEICCDIYEEARHYYNVIDGNIIDLTRDYFGDEEPWNCDMFEPFPKLTKELLERYKLFLSNVRNNMCEYSFEKINGDIRIQKYKEYLDSLCLFSTFEILDYDVEDGIEYVQFDLAAQNTGNLFRYRHDLSTDEYYLLGTPVLYSWRSDEVNLTKEVLDSIFDIARDNKEDIKTLKKLMSINSHK